MNERIKALRKYLGLTQTEFAAKLRITQQSVSMIENGANEPANSTIGRICDVFGCDEVWLRTGEGEMFRQRTEDEELSALLGDLQAEGNPRKMKFFRLLLEITEEAWPLIDRRLDQLLEEQSAGK